MNPIFSGFQKMDIEHYSTQPTNCPPNTYLPNPINGFIVSAHAQLIFEKNVGLLH